MVRILQATPKPLDVNKTPTETSKPGSIISGAKSLIGGFASGVAGSALTAEDYLGRKLVGAFGTEQMKRNIAKMPPLQETFKKQWEGDKNPKLYGTGQLAGEITALSSPVGAIGKTAKVFSKALGAGPKVSKLIQAGTEGVAFTAGQGITEGKKESLSDYAINAGLNVAFPASGMLIKSTVEKMPARIINSLIKPLSKDFAYGKNPGETVAKLGITGNNFDELIGNIKTKQNDVGKKIGRYISKVKNPSFIDLNKTLSPLDNALIEAEKAPETNKALIERIKGAKNDLTNFIEKNATINGLQNAQELKKLIGDITKWTGGVSDDKLVNKALKQTYGQVREAMDKEMSSKLSADNFKKYKEATENYANLQSAENAATYRNVLNQRQDLISLGAKNAGILSALGTFIATGGASLPSILTGLGVTAIDKATASPAFKTRLASLLAKMPAPDIKTFFDKIPTARELFTEKEIKDFTTKIKGKIKP